MERYDAVIKNEGKQDTPRMSTEEWIEMKKRERADLHAIANDMADKALSDPNTLAAYLTLQAKLGRCSLNNTLLVLSQKPDATFVCDAKAWLDRGRGIRKGEGKNAIKQFQQDKEYIREDGSAAMGYKVVRCFDISQTYGKPVRQRVVLTMDMKEKIKARVDFIEKIKNEVKDENVGALAERALTRYRETAKLHQNKAVTIRETEIEGRYLLHALSIWIKNLAFEAFTADLLTDELTTEYRELMELDTASLVEEYEKEKVEAIKKIQEQEEPLRKEQRWAEIFNGVLRGDHADDAERKYDEYVERQQQAYAQLAKQA